MGFITEIHSGLWTLPEWVLQKTRENWLLGTIYTSVYSLDNEKNDLLMGIDNSLQTILKNIELLSKSGFDICVQTPLTKFSFPERNAIREYFIKRNITHRFTWPEDQDNIPRYIDDVDIDVTEEQFEKTSLEYPEFFDLQDVSFEESVEGKPPAITIKANGDIFDSRVSSRSIGNLLKKSLPSIYKERAIMEKVQNNDSLYGHPRITNYRSLVRSRLFDKDVMNKLLSKS